MAELQMGAVESQFADMIWELEPVHSRELVRLAEEKLDWKKSTTYTILKRVCERELFQNVNGIVTSLVSKQEFLAKQSEQFVQENFAGSLPGFITAFTSGRKLNAKEIEELQKLIDESK